MIANDCEARRISSSIWADPPAGGSGQGGSGQGGSGRAQPSFLEDLSQFAVATFERFYEFRPSHVAAFIVSFLCFAFGVEIFVTELIRIGAVAILDMPIYFFVMSGLFVLMGVSLLRSGRR